MASWVKSPRASGMHPIHARAWINQLMPHVLAQVWEMKRKNPRLKYRNMKATSAEHTPTGIRFTISAEWQTAGPRM